MGLSLREACEHGQVMGKEQRACVAAVDIALHRDYQDLSIHNLLIYNTILQA